LEDIDDIIINNTTMGDSYLIIQNIKDVISGYVGLELEESEDRYTILYDSNNDVKSVIRNKQIEVKINRYGIGKGLYTIEHRILYEVEQNGIIKKVIDRNDIHMLNTKELRDRESIIGYFR